MPDPRIRYVVIDPEEKAKHTVHRRKPYVCKCGEEFDRYNDWYKHRTEKSAVKHIEK